MLNSQEIAEKVRSQGKSDLILAGSHEGRISLHSKPTLNTYTTRAVNDFLSFAASLLPPAKYHTFLQLFRFPVPTVSLSSRIYDSVSKVFEPINPVFDYEFSSDSDKEDYLRIRDEEMLFDKWKKDGMEALKSNHNSILIYELPEVQDGDKPMPYRYFLSIENVKGVGVDDDGNIEWVYFSVGDGKFAFYDDTSYTLLDSELVISQTPHDLGYCPAAFFWSENLSSDSNVIKKHPFSEHLFNFDMLLKYVIENEWLNLYARYPIVSVFAADCSFEDGDHYCDRGHLKSSRDDSFIFNDAGIQECPACSKHTLTAPGTVIEVDTPSPQNEYTDLRNPVSITSMPVDLLKYNNTDIRERADYLFTSITGIGSEIINEQAVNEYQIIGIFESMERNLIMPQRNFERIMSWSDKTFCKLRYGSTFVDCTISLGTKHYVLSSADIMSLYTLAKTTAMSDSVLDNLQDLYIKTEFRQNEKQQRRELILIDLDDFRHSSRKEMDYMLEAGVVTPKEYLLKITSSSLIRRFERENGSILLFGSKLEYSAKITRMREIISRYIEEKELKPEEEEETETDLSNNNL